MLKVGILGLGMMGSFHAKRYLDMPGAELVAIADTTPARLEATESVAGNLADEGKETDLSSVARYDDASALIADAGVDVVDICLPTFLHKNKCVLKANHSSGIKGGIFAQTKSCCYICSQPTGSRICPENF